MIAKIRTVLGRGAFGVLASGIMLPLAALATPTITVDRVQQRYPWNNVVDVDYTIAGMTGDPYDYRVELSVTSTALADPVIASNFVNCAWCDLTTSNGTWRASWNAKADGVNFMDANAQVTLKLVYQPIAWSEANYLIIDLSSGSASKNYPARLVRDVAPDPAMFNLSVYKTDRLVLKRAHTVINDGGYTYLDSSSRKILLTNDFLVGVFPVTQWQFAKVYGSNPSSSKTDAEGDLAAHRPVENVHQSNVWGYFNERLFLRTTVRGEPCPTAFSLPTEAQWEYVCRAGATTTYYWGSDSTKVVDYCWIDRNSEDRTHAVGGKLPNNWGFYDFEGNVWEWTKGRYAAISKTDDIVVDPEDPTSGTYSMFRGANYKTAYSSANTYAIGYRTFSHATYQTGGNVGFRTFLRMP